MIESKLCRCSKLLSAKAVAALLALLCAGMGPGCAAPQGAGVVTPGAVRGAYDAGRFREAYEMALELAEGSRGQHRDEAYFLAGMSAHRLGQARETLRHLEPLSFHPNGHLAGPANATVGMVYSQRSDHARALPYFQRAIQHLEGEDLAQAYFHLGVTEQKLGLQADARTHLSLAISKSRNPEFQNMVRQRLETAGYTLQLGAYQMRANADTRARELAAAAQQAGLGSPRVVPSRSSDGQMLYLVQVGEFSTFDSAQSARQKLRAHQMVIVPLAGP